jgi:hypothetical protein
MPVNVIVIESGLTLSGQGAVARTHNIPRTLMAMKTNSAALRQLPRLFKLDFRGNEFFLCCHVLAQSVI